MDIKSLDEYIKEVKKHCLPKDKTTFSKVYFRGEADVTWETEASLFRGKLKDAASFEKDSSYYKNVNYTVESNLIASALIQCPQAFEKCPDAISRLILMQHYGLPTRLYDVTANPLVALYFACCDKFDNDGKVLFIKQENDLWSSQYVNTLAEINEEVDKDKNYYPFSTLFDYARKKRIVPVGREISFEKWLFRNITKSFLIQPPLDNERIKRQQGAVIFSALMKVSELETKDKYTLLCNRNPDDETKGFTFQKYDVNLRNMFEEKEFHIIHQYKEDILNELNMIGINEAFLFPELEHQFKMIKYQNVPKSEWIEI